MTERELIYIKTIAECKSFSQAAKKLYVAQPSLSQCVANVEKRLGTPLFIRSTKGLTLTFAGEHYYRTACNILGMYSDLSNKIFEINSLKRGRINLGITNHLSSLLLPHVLPDFIKMYPGIDISLTESPSTLLEEKLSNGELDFAIFHTCDLLMPNVYNKTIDFHPIHKDAFAIALSKGDPLSRISLEVEPSTDRPVLDPKYLADKPFVLESPEQRIRQVSDLIFQQAGFEPKVILTTRNFVTCLRLAAAGVGATIVPWYSVLLSENKNNADFYAIPYYYQARWTLGVATVKEAYLSNASQVFIDMFLQKVRKLYNNNWLNIRPPKKKPALPK